MPREDRRIIFSFDEVYKSIYTLSVAKQLPKLPPGAITKVEEIGDDKNSIAVTLKNHVDESEGVKEFSRDFFAAALMVFCRGEGIPLPRSAQKSVMIHKGQVILRATI